MKHGLGDRRPGGRAGRQLRAHRARRGGRAPRRHDHRLHRSAEPDGATARAISTARTSRTCSTIMGASGQRSHVDHERRGRPRRARPQGRRPSSGHRPQKTPPPRAGQRRPRAAAQTAAGRGDKAGRPRAAARLGGHGVAARCSPRCWPWASCRAAGVSLSTSRCSCWRASSAGRSSGTSRPRCTRRS